MRSRNVRSTPTPKLLIDDLYAVRSRREVACIMGISPARVQQYEQSAMRRLRRWLRPYFFDDDNSAAVTSELSRRFRDRERGLNSARHGWLRITKMIGNGGFSAEAVCFAFNELRSLHERYYRPPILIGDRFGYASAAEIEEGNLAIRVSLAGSARSLGGIGTYSFCLAVETIKRIPVIAAGVVAPDMQIADAAVLWAGRPAVN